MSAKINIFKIFRKKPTPAVPSSIPTVHSKIYKIQCPEIKTGSAYYFTTDSGLQYEVRFGKIKNSLRSIINFGVLNEEFEDDEYADTNKGEIYRIVATVVEVAKIFMSANIYFNSYEFCGRFKKGNENRKTSIRTLLFYRTAKRILDENWKIKLEGNKVIVQKNIF